MILSIAVDQPAESPPQFDPKCTAVSLGLQSGIPLSTLPI
jgi:hypothetical protein